MASKVWVEVEVEADASTVEAEVEEKGNPSDDESTLEDRLLAWLELGSRQRAKALYSHKTLHALAMNLRYDKDVGDETLVRFIKAVLTGSLIHGTQTQARLHLLFLAIYKRVEERPLSVELASFLTDDYIMQAIIYTLPDDCSARRDIRLRMCKLQIRLRDPNEEHDGNGNGNGNDDDMPALCDSSLSHSDSDGGGDGDNEGEDGEEN